jgi:hypothetical protein
MEKDGLSLADIESCLKRWLQCHPDVEKAAISYTGQRYSVGIFLTQLSTERVMELHLEMYDIRSEFGDYSPIIYIFGPEQWDSSIFTATDCYVLHNQTQHI